jgi:hypothetical protein
MDELIGRLVADLGIDRATAEKAVGIVFEFLASEGPPDKVRPLMASLPGADALLQKAASESARSPAGAATGLFGAGMRMMAAGLSMGQAQSLSREVLAYAREKAGAEVVGATIAAIPGLSQYV